MCRMVTDTALVSPQLLHSAATKQGQKTNTNKIKDIFQISWIDYWETDYILQQAGKLSLNFVKEEKPMWVKRVKWADIIHFMSSVKLQGKP